MSKVLRLLSSNEESVPCFDGINVSVMPEDTAGALLTEEHDANSSYPSFTINGNKVVLPKLSTNSGSEHCLGTAGACEYEFSRIYRPEVSTVDIGVELKKRLCQQISQRNNVFLLLLGPLTACNNINRHRPVSQLCDLLMPLYDSLKAAVMSASEAQAERISFLSKEGQTCKSLRQTVRIKRERSGHPFMQKLNLKQLGEKSALPNQNERHSFLQDISREEDAQTANKDVTVKDRFSSTDIECTNRDALFKAEFVKPSNYSVIFSRTYRGKPELLLEAVDKTFKDKTLLPFFDYKQQSTELFKQHSVSEREDNRFPPHSYKWLSDQRAPKGSQIEAATCQLRGINGMHEGEVVAARVGPERGFIIIPELPGLGEALSTPGGITISFWMKADMSNSLITGSIQTLIYAFDTREPKFLLRVLLSTNAAVCFERGYILISVRDSYNKLMEFVYKQELINGEWHFISLKIDANAKVCVLTVDGATGKVEPITRESVSSFEETRSWVMWVGAAPIDGAGDNAKDNFDGLLMHFTITKNRPPSVVLFDFPFVKNSLICFSDVARNAVNWKQRDRVEVETSLTFPRTAPHFDGKSCYVNVGSLGDFGLLNNGLVFRIVLKTTCTANSSCLFGAVDPLGKHPQFSIELNTNVNGAFQRCVVCTTIADWEGNSASCASEASDLFDGRWHTLIINITDIPTGKMRARLDNRHLEANSVTSQKPPAVFTRFSTFFTLGALNDRGHKVTKYFKGSIKAFEIYALPSDGDIDEGDSDNQDANSVLRVADWHFDEGPFSLICFDHTGHGFNGVYMGGAERLQRGGIEWYTTVGDQTAAQEDELFSMNSVKRFDWNEVTFAAICIVTKVDSRTGQIVEVIEDLVNNCSWTELEIIQHSDFNKRVNKDDKRILLTFPEECYVSVTANTCSTIARLALETTRRFPKSHLFIQLRLGDAMFTVCHPAELSQSEKAKLVITTSHMTWAEATVIDGIESKVKKTTNSSINEMLFLMSKIGYFPQLFKRTTLVQPEIKTFAESMLASIFLFCLTASAEHSLFHTLSFVHPNVSRDKCLFAILLGKEMEKNDEKHAALLIQRVDRWLVARQIVSKRRAVRAEARQRAEREASLRRRFPDEILPKRKRSAIIIQCFHFNDPAISSAVVPSLKVGCSEAIITHLITLGYEIDIITDPTLAEIVLALESKVAEHEKTGSQLFVHFCGIGLYDTPIMRAAPLKQKLFWCEELEAELRRADLLEPYRKEWIGIYTEFIVLIKEIHSREITQVEIELRKRRKDEKKKKPLWAKKKKQTSLYIPPELPAYIDSVLLDEEIRAWESELILPVKPFVLIRDETPAEQRQIFFFLRDTKIPYVFEEVMTLDWLRRTVLGTEPVLGRHSILAFDCVTISTHTEEIDVGGYGGLLASSGEEFLVTYMSKQRLLLNYYLEHCFTGLPSEFMRAGKQSISPFVSIDSAFQYLNSRFGLHGSNPAKHVKVSSSSTFIGDNYLANRIISINSSGKNTRFITRVVLEWSGILKASHKLIIQQAIHKLCTNSTLQQIQPLRICFLDLTVLTFYTGPNCDYRSLTEFEIGQRELEHSVSEVFSAENPQKLQYHVLLSFPPCIALSFLPEANINETDQYSDDILTFYSKRQAELEQFLIYNIGNTISTGIFGTFKLKKGSIYLDCYFSLTESEIQQLKKKVCEDRQLTENASICYVYCLQGEELNNYEQEDRKITAAVVQRNEEHRRRVAKENEKKKKNAEKQRLLQEQYKTLCEGVISECRNSALISSRKTLDEMFSVPLIEAYSEAISVVNAVIKQSNVKQLMDYGLGERLEEVISFESFSHSTTKMIIDIWRLLSTLLKANEIPLHSSSLTALMINTFISEEANHNPVSHFCPLLMRPLIQALIPLSQEVVRARIRAGPGANPTLSLESCAYQNLLECWPILGHTGASKEQVETLVARLSPSITELITGSEFMRFPFECVIAEITRRLIPSLVLQDAGNETIKINASFVSNNERMILFEYTKRSNSPAFISVLMWSLLYAEKNEIFEEIKTFLFNFPYSKEIVILCVDALNSVPELSDIKEVLLITWGKDTQINQYLNEVEKSV